MFKKLSIKNSKKGMSLLGVIFAVGLAVVGLFGIIGVLRYVIVLGRLSSDKFIATNLAEEGIEIVRAIRDTNWQPYMSTYSGATFPISQPTNYLVDYRAASLLGYSDTYLNKNASGFYTYAAGTQTKFKRRMYLDPTFQCTQDAGDQGQCIRIVSEVTWGGYTLVVEDILYNWMP